MSHAPVKVMVAGLGNMGRSHALAYETNPGFAIIGLVNRSAPELDPGLADYPILPEYYAALKELSPDLVSISTYAESHADYAIAAMEAGSHVFLEKPIATNLADAKRVVAAARANGRKLVVGYILRHHPAWVRLIKEARALGGPYVFRMNLNQQSSGDTWKTHKNLMKSTSPIVDCGVHYLDVMCQITDANPVEVRAMGLRLSNEIAPDMYNYGHLQVLFDDGSLGWYEAGWGPMMSETAFFVKDVMSPNGSVSIVLEGEAKSDDHEVHTRTSNIRIHHAELDEQGNFARSDTMLKINDDPGHQGLCDLEQDFVLRAIVEDLDLCGHMGDAVKSLAIALAADTAVKTGKAQKLEV